MPLQGSWLIAAIISTIISEALERQNRPIFFARFNRFGKRRLDHSLPGGRSLLRLNRSRLATAIGIIRSVSPGFYEQVAAAIACREPVALGVISRVAGSSPQKLGAKALFFLDGRIVGTLGGGCLEAEVRERARRSITTGEPSKFELLLDHDFGWDDGLICGGKVEILIVPSVVKSAAEFWRRLAVRGESIQWGVTPEFVIAETMSSGQPTGWHYHETVTPRFALWIGGAGHVAKAVAPLALQVDFDVTVFDDRPALASHPGFPEDCRLEVGDWQNLLAQPLPGAPTFGLVVTRGHNHDALVLSRWINQPFAFLGMIGSRRKKRIIFERLVDDGVASRERVEQVACPVGLDIQSVSVNEIAVSIVAQLIQKRAELLPVTRNRGGAQPVKRREPTVAD